MVGQFLNDFAKRLQIPVSTMVAILLTAIEKNHPDQDNFYKSGFSVECWCLQFYSCGHRDTPVTCQAP